MKEFRRLREQAGLITREEFANDTGYSLRTLTAFDNDTRDPPLFLIRYLRLLASGCKHCPNRRNLHRITKGGKTCQQTK